MQPSVSATTSPQLARPATPAGQRASSGRRRQSSAADSSTIHCTNSEASARRTQLKPGTIGSARTSTSTSNSASSTRLNSASGWHSSGMKKSSWGAGLPPVLIWIGIDAVSARFRPSASWQFAASAEMSVSATIVRPRVASPAKAHAGFALQPAIIVPLCPSRRPHARPARFRERYP
ncbi:hypothetical protein D9M71_431410 [compost metagenome]